MTDTLSQRWLIAVFFAGAVFAGLHPAVLSYLIVVMGFLWLFIYRDEQGAFAQSGRATVLLFTAWLVDAAVSLQWTLDPARALYDFVLLTILTIIALQMPAGLARATPAQAERYLRWLIMGWMIGVLFLAMDLSFGLIWQHAILRVPWKMHLELALTTRAVLCMNILLWPALYYFWQRQWRVTAISVWALTGALTAVSETAAGRLAFIISTVVFGAATVWPRITRLLLAVVIVTGVSVALPVAQVAQDIIESSFHHVISSFGHRTEIWKFTAKRILEKPVFGWGFDSARAIPNMGEISKYQGYDPLKSIIPMHPHNWFLQILLELGIVGAILMTLLWLWLLRLISRLQKSVQPVALAIYAIAIVVGAFSIGIWQQWWLAALVFASLVLQLLNRQASETLP